MKSIHLTVFLFLLFPCVTEAQNYTISRYVMDGERKDSPDFMSGAADRMKTCSCSTAFLSMILIIWEDFSPYLIPTLSKTLCFTRAVFLRVSEAD